MTPDGGRSVVRIPQPSGRAGTNRLLRWINRPQPLTLIALVLGWAGVYYAYLGSRYGVVLAGLCTLG
ncbi:MAG TPA: hypothetical protein VFU23_08035, partial [Gemmatimonadales bacterium]|nr:hypothetical protein [Gemmatimonadales bacterium]